MGANASAQLDPVLSRRFARQQEKLVSGESAVDHVASVASWSSAVVDSALAQKLQQQRDEEDEREKVNTEQPGCKTKEHKGFQGFKIAAALFQKEYETTSFVI